MLTLNQVRRRCSGTVLMIFGVVFTIFILLIPGAWIRETFDQLGTRVSPGHERGEISEFVKTGIQEEGDSEDISTADEKRGKLQGSREEQLGTCDVPPLVYGHGILRVQEKVRYFGLRDGRKGVCLDPAFKIRPGQCRVLSFGICKEWSFDDAMGDFGCKVYSFDPTNGMADHQRSPNIRFYSLGIGREKTKLKLTGKKKGLFKVDRYENILHMLGMTNATIDYLKMDIEKSELGFFRDVFTKSPHLLKNVRQIGMELHHTISKLAKHRMFWKYFHMLKCHGFKLLEARRYFGRTEAVWVRP
ncbi:uncharacterized protein [Palaemon carinicauda]|uniref:uncharacterized protein n=1 Tax=Palaemon carinicauda TaxID=392227 RepID=UPI0035B5B083